MPGDWGNYTGMIKSWLEQPFAAPVSALEIFLGIGLILLFLFFWGKIIAELKPEL